MEGAAGCGEGGYGMKVEDLNKIGRRVMWGVEVKALRDGGWTVIHSAQTRVRARKLKAERLRYTPDAEMRVVKYVPQNVSEFDLASVRLRYIYDDLMTKFCGPPPITFEQYVRNIDAAIDYEKAAA